MPPRSSSVRQEVTATPHLSPWVLLPSPAAPRPTGWTRSWLRWRKMWAKGHLSPLTFLLCGFSTQKMLTFNRLGNFTSGLPCTGVPDRWCCVRAGGDTGGAGAVRSQYQQWNHRYRAGLPGGPGGHCSCSGPAVWTTGAGAVLSLVIPTLFCYVGLNVLKSVCSFKVSNIEARISALKTAGLNVAVCNRFSKYKPKAKVTPCGLLKRCW